ncbi:MAG: short chain dehydrogenase [Candidatus Saganbacteria bacterium]|uniref:Short chain dehydrogenase n=1 Tax=Candidatus Saganbacteria bacterium TaxID=2575572 RepID=A0A833L2L7_UNCSA|nr:MAG: short chain dehydrogenase [Candidatus Saganbacteria bacterium]
MTIKETVLISGGVGVLGQSYAKILEEDGYEIVVIDKQEPAGKDCHGQFFQCDITDEKQVAELGKLFKNRGMTVYGLINNASCQPPGFAEELENYSSETFKRVLEVNLLGSFLLTKAVIPLMKKRKRGSIINIGSIQGVVAPTFAIYEGTKITSPLVYAVAKAGIIHFCKWIAARYGQYNIRCNAVSPGGLCDSQKGGSKFAEVYSSRTPLGRMVSSSEVAELVRFLISDKSNYITGQNILIDGGWTIY